MPKMTLEDILNKEDQAASAPASLPQALPPQIDDPNLRPQFADTPEKQLVEYKVRVAAQQAGIDPHMAASVANKESGFNTEAKSPTGVKGVMQVSGIAAKDLGYNPQDVRNNPDLNIMAGVQYLAKHGLEKYPDPAVKNSYVKDVLHNTEKSRFGSRTLETILDEAGVPSLDSTAQTPSSPVEPTASPSAPLIAPSNAPVMMDSSPNSPSEALAASKSYLDALGIGAVARQMAKSKTLRDINVSVNKMLTGKDQSFEDIARERQGVTSKAQAEHPIASGAGTVAGILAPVGATNLAGKAVSTAAKVIPGAAKAAKMAPTLSKLAKFLTEGAVQGGTYEAVSNPQATQESVTHAAKVGAATNAVMAPVLAGAAKAAKGFGNALINFTTKTGRPEVAEYITQHIGPTLTKTALAEKNQKVLNMTEEALQSHLASLDKAGNAGVDMRKIAQDPGIMKSLESLDNVEERAQVSKLLGKLAKYEEKGTISLQDANQFKRDLYKQANFNSRSSKFNIAKFQESVALNVKNAIEEASGSSTVKQLNQKLQNGIELKNAVAASDSPNKLRTYMEVAAAVTNPTTIPAIAAGRFATSTAGSTLLGTAASKVPQAVNPQVQTLLNTLVPQYKKGLTKPAQ